MERYLEAGLEKEGFAATPKAMTATEHDRASSSALRGCLTGLRGQEASLRAKRNSVGVISKAWLPPFPHTRGSFYSLFAIESR